MSDIWSAVEPLLQGHVMEIPNVASCHWGRSMAVTPYIQLDWGPAPLNCDLNNCLQIQQQFNLRIVADSISAAREIQAAAMVLWFDPARTNAYSVAGVVNIQPSSFDPAIHFANNAHRVFIDILFDIELELNYP